jgi:hypothetical protein
MQIMEIMEGKVALNHPHYHSMVENARKFFFSINTKILYRCIGNLKGSKSPFGTYVRK